MASSWNVQDFTTLGVINARYCGYIAVVEVKHFDKSKLDLSLRPTDIADQPDGGANALNINRYLLVNAHHFLSSICIIAFNIIIGCFQFADASSPKPIIRTEKNT